jgi:hypothetical protein
MDQSAVPSLVATRESLHRVAEHVLSAARKRATGQIALRPGPGGVRTPPFGENGRVVALSGSDIVVHDGAEVRRARLTTVRAAAEFAGVEPGFPWTKHPPGTPFAPDEPLTVDPQAAAQLADWFALADKALAGLAAEIAPAEGLTAQIFPEHFDLAITVDQVNYGASPGDAQIPVPYLYVGPHEGPPANDDYWNAAFGAFLTTADVASYDDALAFLCAGRARLAAARRA